MKNRDLILLLEHLRVEMRRAVPLLASVLVLCLALPASTLARTVAENENTTDRRSSAPEAEQAAEAVKIPDLPEGIASFGAAVSGNDLVVYGGHVGRTHQHSVENLSHRFLRLNLDDLKAGWQDLGPVPGLQGIPLVAHGREVCRIGGLEARNHVGSDEELFSIDPVRCFHLDNGEWRDLPSLPQARSSHDAVVFEGKIYVVGGWQLRGSEDPAVWHQQMAVLDLGQSNAGWQMIDAPFERRALATAAAAGKIFAFGGLGHDGTSREVDVYEIASGVWSKGEELPSVKGLKGFGVSAFGVEDRVYLSGGDGVVHALDAGTGDWQRDLAKLATPRFFHRLLPHGEGLYFIAGAGRGGHRATTEYLALADLEPEAHRNDEIAEPALGLAETATWPGFRGNGSGHAMDADLPVSWSDDQNIPWRAQLPGYGQSAPVLWKGLAFVTSVEGDSKEALILSALALDNGEVRWRRRFPASQRIESSRMVSRGAPTPVVDEDRVYALWESGDLIALSHDGETLWHRSLTRDYGDFKGNHGVASSPVLTQDTVVVQVTHEGPSYFLAVDKATGQTQWKVDRPARVAWTTPVVVPGTYGEEIISSAAGRVEALNASTGERLWVRDGIEKNHVPSVVVDKGLVIVASSEAGHNFALDRLGRGELDDQHVAWTAQAVTSGFGSPVVAEDCVLFVNKAGVATCVDRSNGEPRWKQRVADACWTTPIVSEDRVYFFTKKGKTTVLDLSGDEPAILSESTFTTDDTVYGVAAAHDAFLVRTGSELIKIGRASEQTAERDRSGEAAVASP